jgi:hypothetical protein
VLTFCSADCCIFLLPKTLIYWVRENDAILRDKMTPFIIVKNKGPLFVAHGSSWNCDVITSKRLSGTTAAAPPGKLHHRQWGNRPGR